MSEPEVLHPLRPILRNWVWEHGRVGTRWLDCRTGELNFDDGKKSRFADEAIFYVPLDDDGIESAGPTVHEGALARFLRAAQLGKPEDAGSVADVQRAVQECIEIGLVCAYQAEARAALARYRLEPLFEDEIRAAAASDIRARYVGVRAQLALYDFTVFHGLPAPLLCTEAPFIDWRVRAKPVQPFVSLPLGPYCLLVGTPSGKKSRAGPVLWKTAAVMGPFRDHNRILVEDARAWIVASSDDELLALQPRYAPPPAPGPEGSPV
jgi:hypothetical protein